MRISRAYRKFYLLKARILQLKERGELKNYGIEAVSAIKYRTQSIEITFAPGPRHDYGHLRTRKNDGTINDQGVNNSFNAFASHVWGKKIEEYIQTTSPKNIDAILSLPLNCNDLGVFSFAKIIGLNPLESRYVIDLNYQTHLPGFSSLIMEKATASEFIEEFGGLYYLYRSEKNDALLEHFGTNDVISKAILSIRYPIPHRHTRKTKFVRRASRERIRAKMVFPLYPTPNHSRLQIGKYDGFVSPTRDNPDYWQWLLELRPSYPNSDSDITQDMLLMYSTKPKHHALASTRISTADMFSQSQSGSRSPALSPAVLLKLDNYMIREFLSSEQEDSKLAGYFGLFNLATNEAENERHIMREKTGFIINGNTLITRDRKEAKPSDYDLAGIDLLKVEAKKSHNSV